MDNITLEEFNSKMTLFYSKRTGEIMRFCTGVQTMDYFHTNKEDYEQIWDFVVVPIDMNVLNNCKNFRVNTETKIIELLPSAISQYPIAST